MCVYASKEGRESVCVCVCVCVCVEGGHDKLSSGRYYGIM